MATLLTKMNEAANMIQSRTEGMHPEIGLILGSGLGELADEIENAVQIDYSDIPHFPVSTVEGHAGKLVIGTLNGKTVLAMQGRFHFYEGYSMQDVTFPVRVMKGLGVKLLIVTNACGGMNPEFSAGDLMIIDDHLNMTGANPLIGPNDAELGPRFPDMSTAYTPELVQFTKDTAANLGIKVQHGVYAGITGPTYMTKAELRMLRTVGGDAIGMSTVPEVIVASHMSLKVIGISCITDMAIADELEPLTHEQVVAVANRTKPKFINLVKELVKNVTL
ncbi:purine-nucleoside phosphorylase [Fictibacillus sp. WQ 8-8]|uniref:purine-nucleoside phosphorylase n=1 Tax=unclassified Fictibacillus TaxID=2644029 RepID=UPI0008E2F0C6|nr:MULTISPECIES: purine-nucleoside phosphorylase [unclassified Fictibacillus]MCQ6266100.1 purine-nucleoside phosphorylase [Fictibacillus sp. WQ 8-8]MED2972680.1 purine-nucleoside phosphorylase [Fictibacillus sp. B-59209]SFD71801.1 purine-nucleoside phosphorylase [Bacillus sp. OV194]